MFSWLRAPEAGRAYSLTRFRSAANTSLDAPTVVFPNVNGSPCARGASQPEALRHPATTHVRTPSGLQLCDPRIPMHARLCIRNLHIAYQSSATFSVFAEICQAGSAHA